MYRLHIIPINFKNAPHKLFSLEKPNLSSDTMTEPELKDLLLDVKIPLCVTRDIFGIHSESDPFWSHEKKRFIRIMYYVSELQEFKLEMIGLLEKNFCLDVFVDQPYHPDIFDFFSQISIHPSNLRFVVVENQLPIQSQNSIFETIPSSFKSCIYFLYLPPSSNDKLILSATEVMSRIDDRRQECQEHRENLKVLSITNNQVFRDEPHKKIFYLNPTHENYFKYQQQLRLSSDSEDRDRISRLDFYLLKSIFMTKKLMSLFITISLFFVWKLRHIYWGFEHLVTAGAPKLVSNLAKGYWTVFAYLGHIRVQLIKLFWTVYSLIANLGILIRNIPGKSYKLCIEYYWKSRKIMSNSFAVVNVLYWKFRRFLSCKINHIVQLGWKSKSFLSILCINLYWKFRKNISSALNFIVQLSWNLKSTITIFSIRTYWFLRKYMSDFLNLCVQSYWEIRTSKYMRPIFKIYWFISFQFKKRIVSLFKKKSNL